MQSVAVPIRRTRAGQACSPLASAAADSCAAHCQVRQGVDVQQQWVESAQDCLA